MIEQIKRIKRAIKFYKLITYGGSSWWLTIPTDMSHTGGTREHALFTDWDCYNKKGLAFKIEKAQAAWYIAKEHILTKDGFYTMIPWSKKETILYKIQ